MFCLPKTAWPPTFVIDNDGKVTTKQSESSAHGCELKISRALDDDETERKTWQISQQLLIN